MALLQFFSRNSKVIITLSCIQMSSTSVLAGDLEITSLLGYTNSPNLISDDSTTEIETTNEPNIAFAFSWQESVKGQGQILINYISRDFTDNIDQSTYSFDTLYAHFNGVSFYQERNYTTTVGIGVGVAYFNSDFNDALYPSVTFALGTRYTISDNLTFITELRAYATLTKENDTVFCQNENCVAHFDDTLWIDKQFSIGLAYNF
jgi:hypothetical protein